MKWTPEDDERLRHLIATKRSFSDMAALFGNGVTKNSLIGRAHRLGLYGQSQKRKRKPPPPPPPPPPPIEEIEEEPPPMPPDPNAPHKITVLQLNKDICHWPIGEATGIDTEFCGAPVARGPYCAKHGMLAYGPKR